MHEAEEQEMGLAGESIVLLTRKIKEKVDCPQYGTAM